MRLIALSDQIVADGGKPWCIGINDSGAKGWVGTDWVEDILLRTAPPETYDAWVRGELPFDSPEIRRVFEIMGQNWLNEEYIYGRRVVDQMALILPFEEELYRKAGVRATFVGHPLLDEIKVEKTVEEIRTDLNFEAGGITVALLPGSREGEIQRNWPLCRDVALRLLSEGRAAAAVVGGTAGGYYPEPGPIRICRSQSDVVLAASTAALLKSGTAALEAALVGTPMVVAYRSSWPTYAIARQVMTVDRISLVNLIAGADVVPEFWHLPVSARPVTDGLRPLLDPESAAFRQQRAGLETVRSRLGAPGAAARVADLALGLAT